MKSTLDEQIDKFEDENNFLNIDPEAEKISFYLLEKSVPEQCADRPADR